MSEPSDEDEDERVNVSIEASPIAAPRLEPLTVEQQRSLTRSELSHELALICRAVARACGDYLIHARTVVDAQTTSEKESHHDPVTIFDREVETAVSHMLAHLVPGCIKLGEEHGEETLIPTSTEPRLPDGISMPDCEPHVDTRSLGSRVRWIVDPIDGTSNFAAGLTGFNTSIAAELDGEIVAGAVHVPCAHETFWANAEDGWLESEQGFFALDSRGPQREEDAVLLTYFPLVSELQRYPQDALEILSELSFAFRALRRPGAAALDLAHVAAGRAGAFFATALKPWDVAAGGHLVRVAGGSLIDSPLGTDTQPGFGPAVAASARGLDAPTLSRVLQQVERARQASS